MDSEQIGDQNLPVQNKSHVVILHEKISRRAVDTFLVTIALACQKVGNKVTIITSNYGKLNCITDIKFPDNILIQYCGSWIPQSFLGFFKGTFSTFKAVCMAFKLIFFPPHPKPNFVVLDVNLWALYILKCFTNYKLYYVENFTELKNSGSCFEDSIVTFPLLKGMWLKLADEVIVESVIFSDILVKSYPFLSKKPKVLYPSIDLGSWNKSGISVNKIIPNKMDQDILFLTIGKFRKSSNFQLALDSFELLLDLNDDKVSSKRFRLVIAGDCTNLSEKLHYNELIAMTKKKFCASQVSIIKQLPSTHENALILASTIIIHPAKNDVYSDVVLKAMYLGKPIVATNTGISSKLLVHRHSGIILDPEPKAFAVALKKLIANPHLQFFLGQMVKDVFKKSYSFNNFCNHVNLMMKVSTPFTNLCKELD